MYFISFINYFYLRLPMPYFKFASKQERENAYDIELDLTEKNGGKVQGLIAIINDAARGKVDFYSKEPYLEAFDKAGIKYELVPKEQISTPYLNHLRARYPELSDEL